MDSMNTRLNIKKLDENIVQKHRGSKQVGFKQLGPGVEAGVHGVHDEKHVWFEVELHGAQRDHKVEVFHVSNDDTIVAQRRLEDKQPEEKTNTDCLVLHGFEFEVEPQKNVDQGAGLQEVQTQNLMDYQLARDREQHLACEKFRYREDSNEAAFAAVDKIYAHESLTFDDIVACEVIFQVDGWIERRYGCSIRCAEIRVTKGLLVKAKGNVLDLKIIRDQSVRSQEYQAVCTRPNITSAVVDMLDGFDHGLQTNHIEALSTTEAKYMTFTKARKNETWLKKLLTELRYELRLVACIATGVLVKGCSRSEVPAQVKDVVYRY
nr:hypothetical protein [Tanacetum cinerariifolium]